MNDGGPAYPVECYFENGKVRDGVQTSNATGWATGMSLRDAFAIAALPGLLGIDTYRNKATGVYGEIADECYKLADAMLAARTETSQ